MKTIIAGIVLPVALALIGCGTSGTNPLRPQEADFRVIAPNGTPYSVVVFQASNGPEHHPPSYDLTAPHTFTFLNAGSPDPVNPGVPPAPMVRGIFQGDPSAADDVNIELRLGFVDSPQSIVATASIPAGSDTITPIGTRDTPEPDDSLPEVRIEVTAVDSQNLPAVDVQFSANIGDAFSTFLTCGDNVICHTPTTFYFENPSELISAVIGKITQDDRNIVINLYVDNQLRDSGVATNSNADARVRADL
jgi:hypothetical protein